MEEGNGNSSSMTAERVIKILAKHQEVITVQQAEKMLEMINLFAGIAVNQYLRSTKVKI
jgi:hypothetical protein